jgi:nucleoside-diphosphate-sugar epimerase
MKLVFLGGTGNLSRDCTSLALARGHDVYHVNRGKSRGESDSLAKTVVADIRNPRQALDAAEELARAAMPPPSRENGSSGLPGTRSGAPEPFFDAVVDFIAFTPEEVLADFDRFAGLCRQFVFISSASVYSKPSPGPLISENSPVGNPHWKYAADKLACEEALRARASPSSPEGMGNPALTIVRPSHTYSNTWIPSPFVSGDFTLAARIMAGKALLVPGDGAMRWTLTHTRDFAIGLLGLCGNAGSYGRTVQIMSAEAPSWNEIHLELARALGELLGQRGVELPEARLVHVPLDFIARADPESGAKLLGDKGYTSIFDCSLLRSLVPEFAPAVSYADGIRESLAWFFQAPERMKINPAIDATMDRILTEWKRCSPS